MGKKRESCRSLLPTAARAGLLGLEIPPSLGGHGVSFACKAHITGKIYKKLIRDQYWNKT